MALKVTYEKKEDIPDQFQELYSERGGKWELTGVEGIKTTGDTDRLSESLRKEREEHAETKAKLKRFEGLDPDKVHETLDENEELKIRLDAAKAEGKIDEDKLEQLVEQRVRRQVAPVERENARLKEENQGLVGERDELNGRITASRIETAVRKTAESANVLGTAIDDIVMHGERVLKVTEDGEVVTRDNVGVTPDVGIDVWLGDMKATRPHWWPTSQGGGANGNDGGSVPGLKNPWSAKHWNLTDQGQVVREHGKPKAEELARAAGSHLGATAPAKRD